MVCRHIIGQPVTPLCGKGANVSEAMGVEYWIMEREGRMPAPAPATDDGGWIACSERMPPESTRVLVAHTGLSLFVRPGTWQDGEWWKDGGMALVGVVTHWRPLPPAPEGAGEKR